ncbi:MAG TPA: FimV/HubP family polar landmark protein [Burkholderiaceae bacterium]|nr:FimV/HubP family polar landmark protein [Burkholderiaceae bacterium]
MPTMQELNYRLAYAERSRRLIIDQSTRTRRIAWLSGVMALLAASLLCLPHAHAAGLGRLSVHSDLGQPLNAEVEVPSVGKEEAPSLQVRLASPAAFKQANLEFNQALTQLRFDLQTRPDGNYVVRISSAQAINEPYIDLLLELTWSSGRVLREYTVLLDPPGLRQAPEIVAPVAAAEVAPVAPPAAAAPVPETPAAPAAMAPAPGAPSAPVATTEAAAPAPQEVAQPTGQEAAPPAAPQPVAEAAPAQPMETQPPAPPASAPAPVAAETPMAPPAPTPAPAPSNYHVKYGDTLSKIAIENKAPGVSLDQMLVALLQANPKAFVGGNMNRLLAGRELDVPSSDTAIGIDQAEAHREVVAQSADFAAYRSRLAQLAQEAPAVQEQQPLAAGQGKVTTKVEEKGAPPKTGDQLKIAKAETGGEEAAPAAKSATAKKDEEIARQRAIKEEQDRAAALAKANADIKKANELAAAAAATAQKQAEAAKAAAAKAEAAKAEAAKAEAAKAEALKAEAAKAEAAKAEAAKAEAAKVEAAKAEAAKAEAAKAEAAKAEAAKAEAAKAEAAKAEAAQQAAEAAKLAAAKQETAKKEAPKAAPAPAAAPPAGGLVDSLTSPVALGSAGGALLVALVGLNVMRRRRTAGTDQLKGEGDLAANSLFGTAGGQSVDTGATSTFNSSFIPAASQLDSNEVDPVAEADVYIAYGREEQAEDILKEALRLQPDRHPVRVKLLEIYSRRGDKASFNAVAQELHDRTGGVGEDWERAAKLGKSLDPTNSMFAGAATVADTGARGPTTDLNLALGAGKTPAGETPSIATNSDALQFDTLSHMVGDQTKLRVAGADTHGGPETALTPETATPVDSRLQSPLTGGPSTTSHRFEPKLPPEPPRTTASISVPEAQPVARAAGPAPSSIDFGALDFDLGPSKLNLDAQTELPVEKEAETPAQASAPISAVEPPTIPSLDLMFPPTVSVPRPAPPTVTGSVPIPNLDLNVPPSPATRPEGAPAIGSLEEALSRPTLVGAVGAMSDEEVPRLTTNTDQATVPLIDFDLTGADAAITGRRTETQAGSPMASQMATKLDLARGYIDLGVKDGARELLEEVMKDGTREQRQQAVELIKLVEA